MAIKDITIPFKYCRLDRATKLLKCENEDLITLAIDKKISLCLMLDSYKSFMYVHANIEECHSWFDTLPSNYKYPAMGKAITDYSCFSFDFISSDENDDPVRLPLFEDNEHVDGCFTCVGRAFGLWRLTERLDDLLNYNVSYISGNEFTPCLPSDDNPVKQLMEYKILDKPEDEMTVDELLDANRGMRITGNDLWITAVDVRRLIELQGDYHLLDTAYQQDLIMPKSLNNAPHHSAERHATNREQVLMAAFRFKDENEKLFESECRKDDGSYNFSAWARLILERPFLFPDAEIKIKTEDSVSTIIGNTFKPPSQRRK